MAAKASASFILALVALTQHVAAFQLRNPAIPRALPRSPRRPLVAILHNEPPNKIPNEELQDLDGIGQINSDSVDWDAEWKKVVESKEATKRPNPYKSQIEIEAIKATNKAIRAGNEVKNKVARNVFESKKEVQRQFGGGMSMRSLQGDWRFWIGIIVIISFGLSLLSATAGQTSANESFYI